MTATCLDKLRLYRCRVNAFVVEERLHFLGNSHVVADVKAADVRRRNDTIAGKLPDMELVHSKHAFHLYNTYTTQQHCAQKVQTSANSKISTKSDLGF